MKTLIPRLFLPEQFTNKDCYVQVNHTDPNTTDYRHAFLCKPEELDCKISKILLPGVNIALDPVVKHVPGATPEDLASRKGHQFDHSVSFLIADIELPGDDHKKLLKPDGPGASRIQNMLNTGLPGHFKNAISDVVFTGGGVQLYIELDKVITGNKDVSNFLKVMKCTFESFQGLIDPTGKSIFDPSSFSNAQRCPGTFNWKRHILEGNGGEAFQTQEKLVADYFENYAFTPLSTEKVVEDYQLNSAVTVIKSKSHAESYTQSSETSAGDSTWYSTYTSVEYGLVKNLTERTDEINRRIDMSILLNTVISDKKRIPCPLHLPDNNPSAVLLKSNNDYFHIYCFHKSIIIDPLSMWMIKNKVQHRLIAFDVLAREYDINLNLSIKGSSSYQDYLRTLMFDCGHLFSVILGIDISKSYRYTCTDKEKQTYSFRLNNSDGQNIITLPIEEFDIVKTLHNHFLNINAEYLERMGITALNQRIAEKCKKHLIKNISDQNIITSTIQQEMTDLIIKLIKTYTVDATKESDASLKVLSTFYSGAGSEVFSAKVQNKNGTFYLTTKELFFRAFCDGDYDKTYKYNAEYLFSILSQIGFKKGRHEICGKQFSGLYISADKIENIPDCKPYSDPEEEVKTARIVECQDCAASYSTMLPEVELRDIPELVDNKRED